MTEYSCAIIDTRGDSAAARTLAQALAQLGPAPRLDVQRLSPQALAAMPRPPALLLPLVDAGNLAQLLAWLSPSALRSATIAVGDGLDGAQIEALLQAGATDYLSLPQLAQELPARLHRALGLGPATGPSAAAGTPEPATDSAPGRDDPRLRHLIGRSPSLAQQVAKLTTYAGCDAGVLITGETGTGKEIFAQAIHYLSPRADRPWVALNCAAIPGELFESELFGHVRGAFTHAQTARLGLVHEAGGGTLFLDDIDCMPLPAQAKLLRFLQESEYRQVGSNTVQHADVRVIASSNRHLGELAARGAFRQDLYFRLAVLTLALPPLRERREDIAALALHFLRHGPGVGPRPSRGAPVPRRPGAIAPGALARLMAHDWPGNVRELKHVIERAAVLARGEVLRPEDIDFGERDRPAGASLDAATFRQAKARLVEDFERSYIQSLLANHGGNVTHAAQAAQKNRRAFFELMRKHQIDPARYRANGNT